MQSYRLGTRKDKRAAGDSGAWVIQDKINEIRGKLTLKRRDQEAYYVFSQQQIKENEALIKSLRAEIHAKRVEWKFSSNADEYVIKEGFKKHRESQLAMQRYTVAKAIKEKNEHVFDKVGELNAARHEKNSRIRKKKYLALILRDKILAAKTNFEDEEDQRIRVLMTSIDKMKLKYSSARFIQRTYLQILGHLERENLKLPGRLRALEQSIRDNRSELDGDLYQIQQDAKKAYDNTKSVKEKMEEKILKEKRRRDKDLAHVRKRFKKMNQKEEKDYRPRRRNPNKHDNDGQEDASVKFWKKVNEFWIIKRAMDHLREAMSLSHPNDIALCFQRQINRQRDLHQTVNKLNNRKQAWIEDLECCQSDLVECTKAHNAMVEETQALENTKTEQLRDLESERQATQERASKLESLLLDVVGAIGTIHQKMTTCDWIPKQLRQRHGEKHNISSVISSGDLWRLAESDDTVKVLNACGDKLRGLLLAAEISKSENEDLLNDFASDEAQEMLVSATSRAPQNTRIVIADEDDLLLTEDFFGDDDDTNDKYLSRETIKNAMLQLTENQTTRKKRRRPKKE